MLNAKKVAIFGFLLLVIGAVGAFLTYPSMADTEPRTEVHIFDEEIIDVEVDTDNSRLEIVATADETATVEFDLPSRLNQRFNLEAAVEDGVLVVNAKEKILSFFNFDFNLKPFVTRVYLPEKMYDGIILSTDNGEIIVDNLSASLIEAATTNGKITLDRLNADRVTANASNGSIHFAEVNAVVSADTTNGEISLQKDVIEQPIDFKTTNGKINLRITEMPNNAEIRADVTNGSVDIFGEDSNFRTFGDGETIINLKTTNGSITVEN